MKTLQIAIEYSVYLPPANEVWGKVIFLHLFVILFTGGCAWFYLGGRAWFYLGGMHGFIRGGMHGFIQGGMHGFIQGGMHGFIRGACMVLFLGGVHGFIRRGVCVVLFGGGMRGFIRGGGVRGFFSFFGYNEIRSMSGRYASYWNAFLLVLNT